MPSNFETFWELGSFAVVGNQKARNFPKLTYTALKNKGKRVFPVDPSIPKVDDDLTYTNLQALPEPVEGVILEVPKEETTFWIDQAAKANIKDLWIHMRRETPEAVALAQKNGMNVRFGTCAVMYLTDRLTYHSIHKWIMKTMGKY